MVISGITQQVPYRETDWSNPMASGLVRTVSGRMPSAADEIAVSPAPASKSRLSLGDTVRYPWASPPPTSMSSGGTSHHFRHGGR
ncbi:hypothetical protein [Kitasatospora phosalacinea]|uniref:Uncharacterized protein n=1 Tax=Kitasatospora phosalacinea TaxID=2065 RepID=A0A9W6PGY0_9ACTN|nr:hypothetical protein [Kitasatospora phosalacinea]GLW54661.1 hypothetical protein Kpho01_26720 [Kitasatospora phosalacinea]